MMGSKSYIDNKDEACFEPGGTYEVIGSLNGNNGKCFKIIAPHPYRIHVYSVEFLDKSVFDYHEWQFTVRPLIKYVGQEEFLLQDAPKEVDDNHAGQVYNPITETWSWF